METLISIRNKGHVPPFPDIFQQRVRMVPYFYSNASNLLATGSESFVFLPTLFLNNSSTRCRDAAFQVVSLREGVHFRIILLSLIQVI